MAKVADKTPKVADKTPKAADKLFHALIIFQSSKFC